MEIKNTNNTSILDYLKTNSDEKTFSNSNNSFDDIFSKTTSTKNKNSKASQFYDNKNDYTNSNNFLKDKESSITNNSFEKEYVKTADVKPNDKPKDISSDKNINSEKSEKTENSDNKVEEVDDIDNEKLEKLAEYLNIPVEQLANIMEELNLEVDELVNLENIKELLITVNELESSADLLSVDNLKEQISFITDLAKSEITKGDNLEVVSLEEVDIETLPNNIQENTEQSQSSENSTSGQNSNNQGDSTNSLFKDVVDIEVTKETKVDTFNETVATKDVLEVSAENIVPVATQGETNNLVSNEFNISSDINFNNNISNTATVAKTLVTSNTDTHNIIKQITEAMKVEVKDDATNVVRITLRPQHLGDVTLKIVSDNGIITAQFEAESQRVKEIIEANFNQLRDSLKQQGIEITDLQVNVNQNNQNNSPDSDLGNSRNGNKNLNSIDGDIIEDESIIDEVSEETVVGSTSSFKA